MERLSENKRLKSIEGLRGICAIVVVISHFVVAFYPAAYWGNSSMSHINNGMDVKMSQSPFSIFYAGNLAVCIFFVICGFGITISYFTDGNGLKKTLVNRFGRMFFPVLTTNLTYYMFLKLNLFSSTSVAEITGSEWLKNRYLFEGNFVDAICDSYFSVLLNGGSKYNGVIWTISYLFWGAFLVFIVLYLCERSKKRWVVYLCACLVIWSMGTIGNITYNYFVGFILGIVLADIYLNDLFKVNLYIFIIFLIIACFLGAYPMGVEPNNIYRFLNLGKNSAILWHIISAGIIVYIVINSKKLGYYFESKIIQFLGRISFSMFLLHLLILCSFSTILFRTLFLLGLNYSSAFILTFVLSLFIILGCSYLFFSFIERNITRLLNRIYSYLFE